METKEALDQIRQSIKDEKNDIAESQIMQLASEHQDDAGLLLTCASALRTIGDDRDFPAVIEVLMTHIPAVPDAQYEVASGMIGLGCLREADRLLADLEPSDKVRRARAAVDHGLERDNEALAELDAMQETDKIDRVLKVQVLGSLGRHDKAIACAEALLKDQTDYTAGRCYISALVLADRRKDALKFAREQVKTKTADGYALMAYYQWVNNNSTAAGAYSSKALQLSNQHLGALETIGYSFADKGNYWEAKVAVGAINEIEPGNPAVFRILSMCRRAE
ncbi:MAG: hypothetical protein PHT00_01135 [Candidatus Methanomethylophilus sp.]|nr:hypothetical protein [Methanomethylophilus sp.]MDD3232761.1 hypothetical protein [Methanomethylophilus sp.]MDD4221809.1 hypothetical protein [Methanomethylophilus sp.]MDD4668605.1 hypothetical protein [Methanomethylophilus sp.]